MKQSTKNLMKLFALSSLMTGCVMRSPMACEKEVKVVENGKPVKKTIVSYGNAEQFTPLGNIWNSGTYGVLGTGWGMIEGWQDGFNNTNSSYVVRPFNAGYQAIKGVGTGLYNGVNYGFNLDYQTGRSVEGKILDTLDHTSDYFFEKFKSIYR